MTITLNKTNKNYKRSQKGRSMVEMLGVLAIIGVLSVGGVYGYGVAMKKHKANELLHQASMLASSIAAQIASGKTDLALENFGNSSYGTFSEIAQPNDEQFEMKITGMDSAVCEQMAKMAGGMVRQVECGTADANGKTTATLKFNNNLSSEPVAGDYNGNQEKCEDAGNKYCEGSESCIDKNKECPCKEADIVKLLNCDGSLTDCCTTNETCEQPICECTSDDDCPTKQSCENGVCVCPGLNGYLGTDAKTCCDGGAEWYFEYDYSWPLNPTICGCPSGNSGFPKNDGCCVQVSGEHPNGEMVMYYLFYNKRDPSISMNYEDRSVCGCPEGSYCYPGKNSYCSLHDCPLDCNGFPCAIKEVTGETYDDMLNTCGSPEFIVTLKDLDCSYPKGSNLDCPSAPNTNGYHIINHKDSNEIFYMGSKRIEYNMLREFYETGGSTMKGNSVLCK